MLVLSDGEDTVHDMTLDQLLANLGSSAEAGISSKVFAIALGEQADRSILERIAETTGGKHYDSDSETIKGVYALIATFFWELPMRSPIVTGLTHPFAILTLVVSAIAGLIAAWWPFPLGLVLWVVMAINVARDPALRLSHKMQKRAPVAGRSQQHLERLQRSQVSILNSVKSAPS